MLINELKLYIKGCTNMKKIMIFILTVSLLLSSFTISTYAEELNNGYVITPNSDEPIITTNMD